MPDREPLPREWLSPLAATVDETLTQYGYRLTPAIEAIDDAIPGPYGLFEPATTGADIRAACKQLRTASSAPTSNPQAATQAPLVLYVDGSARGPPGPAGAGAVLQAGETRLALGRPVGTQTNNNVAEYAALHLGLDAALRQYDPTTLEVRIDSMTVINEVWRDQPTEASFAPYADAVADLLAQVPRHRYTHLADSDPNPADAHATVGADLAALGR